MLRYPLLYFLLVYFLAFSCQLTAADASSITLKGFKQQAQQAEAYQFQSVSKKLDDSGITHEVVAFEVDGLKQFALVLWPAGQAPADGWPLLIYNHGFHPDPINYGRIEGMNSRPGAYYWDSAQAYALQGYVVVAADYRGHNDSQVQSFSNWQKTLNAFSLKMHGVNKLNYWYTRDVIAAYSAAIKLPAVNLQAVYMAGHSMGGGITQRAILALGARIKAASIWSTGAAHQQLEAAWPELTVPLLIQHGEGDGATKSSNSKTLAHILSHWQRPHQLVIVDTRDHLFKGEYFSQAVERDLNWFSQYR